MSMLALRAGRTPWATRGSTPKPFPASRTHAPRTAALCVYVRRCRFVRDTGYLLARLCLHSAAVVPHGPRGVKAKAFRASCTHARTDAARALSRQRTFSGWQQGPAAASRACYLPLRFTACPCWLRLYSVSPQQPQLLADGYHTINRFACSYTSCLLALHRPYSLQRVDVRPKPCLARCATTPRRTISKARTAALYAYRYTCVCACSCTHVCQ